MTEGAVRDRVFAFVALLGLGAPAQAQPAAPDATSTAAPAPVATAAPARDRSDWDARYAAARGLLARGDFGLAAAEFAELVRTAPTATDGARATELGQLAYDWDHRGIALVERKALIGSDIEARHADRRTSDEIGVLYTTSVLYGLGTGIWADVVSKPDKFSGTLILSPLLFAGAAAGGVALLDSGRGFRYGVGQSIASGMYIGLWQGIAWTTYLQASSAHDNQLSGPQYATALWGSATAGAIVGGVVGTQSSTTPGRATFVSSTSLWPALILGFGVAGTSADNHYRDDHALLAASLGATGGAVAGILTAGTVSPTTARVRFLDLGGLSGALLGGGLYLAATGDHAEFSPFSVLTALGTTAGLTVAWFATANMPQDEGAAQQSSSFNIHPQMLAVSGGAALGFSGGF
jgi:hypothetical protein